MKNFKKVIIGVCAATTLLASSVNTFADEVSAREEKDTYKVGFVSWNIGHTVPAAWDEGIQRQFASFPNIEYTAFDGEASTEKQVSIMNDADAENVQKRLSGTKGQKKKRSRKRAGKAEC